VTITTAAADRLMDALVCRLYGLTGDAVGIEEEVAR